MTRRRIQALATVGALMAITPIVLGLEGGIWPAVHVTGGLTALLALIVAGSRLPRTQRILAAAGVIISIVVISIVTGGGSLGTAVQIAVLIVLGAIFIYVIFWPHGAANADSN